MNGNPDHPEQIFAETENAILGHDGIFGITKTEWEVHKEYVVEGLENHNRNLVVQKERSIENAKRLHPDLPENILEEPILFLKFNTRIYNALKRHNVDTIGELLDTLTLPKWIQSFSNIGEQSQREIVQKMESLGLTDDSYASVREIKIWFVMLNDIGKNVMIKTKVVKRRKHFMNLYEKNIKDLREIVNELYSHVSSVGAYSNLATEIERSCSSLM